MSLNNEGCFDFESNQIGGYADSDLAEATVKTVRDLIDRYMKEKTEEEAAAEIPN